MREITGRKWGRLFAYDEYLGILNEGTEPLREVATGWGEGAYEGRCCLGWGIIHDSQPSQVAQRLEIGLEFGYVVVDRDVPAGE